MSLDSDISSIAESLKMIAQHFACSFDFPKSACKAADAAPIPIAPVMVTPAPMVTAPVPVATSACPFTDSSGMMAFVMEKYKAYGPIKGAAIQGVLHSLGCTNINDVTPDKYAAFYAGVMGIA